ncbi:hypothetical protein GCM10023206_06900 [Acinetobacter puyangensis]|uniref:Uncharacterized protein n=1 Tax=Acinetobacter puyangensis TaxID=1096779 RepID=A0A240E8M5_9GAMM|nr:hypothetical protein [Acinetobacter puyangensis]SNX44230.1 hypothetical protein SAMN05421731_102391 [Acinetobacter puyangensis]
MKNEILSTCLVTLCLSGCMSSQINRNYKETRQDISVEDALPQIAIGIANMKKNLDAESVKAGVYVDDIQLEINLSANASKDGKLGIAADPLSLKSLSKSVFSFDASQDTKIEDLRGSKLVIKFKSANQYNLEYLEKLKGLASINTAKQSNESTNQNTEPDKKQATASASNSGFNINSETINRIIDEKAVPSNVMNVINSPIFKINTDVTKTD